jgi:hypothetical protein
MSHSKRALQKRTKRSHLTKHQRNEQTGGGTRGRIVAANDEIRRQRNEASLRAKFPEMFNNPAFKGMVDKVTRPGINIDNRSARNQ